MKELKCGDFVWSKMYGNGLVYSNNTDGSLGILFEGKNELIFSVRSDLFAKGDEVESDNNKSGIFLGITHYKGGAVGTLIIETDDDFYYASDIKHKPIDKLEIILTLNGKEIDAKAISRETWDNLKCQ